MSSHFRSRCVRNWATLVQSAVSFFLLAANIQVWKEKAIRSGIASSNWRKGSVIHSMRCLLQTTSKSLCRSMHKENSLCQHVGAAQNRGWEGPWENELTSKVEVLVVCSLLHSPCRMEVPNAHTKLCPTKSIPQALCAGRPSNVDPQNWHSFEGHMIN